MDDLSENLRRKNPMKRYLGKILIILAVFIHFPILLPNML